MFKSRRERDVHATEIAWLILIPDEDRPTARRRGLGDAE